MLFFNKITRSAMSISSTASILKECFTKKVPNIRVFTKENIIDILKNCYDNSNVKFTNCDNACIVDNIFSNQNNAPTEPAGYEPTKVEDFYNTAAYANVELCYYNCHASGSTEL